MRPEQPMPLMNTMFSRGYPKSGITFWALARME